MSISVAIEYICKLVQIAQTELKWTELGPCIYRYFDFHSRWKLEYEHPFSISNSDVYVTNYNNRDLSFRRRFCV